MHITKYGEVTREAYIMLTVFLYSHSESGGLSHLLSFIEHAAIWSAIRRFMYNLPLPVVAVIFVVACIGVLLHRRRGGTFRRGGKTITVTKDKNGNVTGTREVTRQ